MRAICLRTCIILALVPWSSCKQRSQSDTTQPTPGAAGVNPASRAANASPTLDTLRTLGPKICQSLRVGEGLGTFAGRDRAITFSEQTAGDSRKTTLESLKPFLAAIADCSPPQDPPAEDMWKLAFGKGWYLTRNESGKPYLDYEIAYVGKAGDQTFVLQFFLAQEEDRAVLAEVELWQGRL